MWWQKAGCASEVTQQASNIFKTSPADELLKDGTDKNLHFSFRYSHLSTLLLCLFSLFCGNILSELRDISESLTFDAQAVKISIQPVAVGM